MKYVFSYKGAIYISLFGIVLFSILTLICFGALISAIYNNQSNMILVDILGIAFFSAATSLYVFALNRLGCKIYYDNDNHAICRQGFICGYKYQLKIDDIKEVILAPIPRETTFYIFLDDVNLRYGSGDKKSYIKIEKNSKNENFIKQFWDKPIKEYKTYPNYPNL